MLFCILYGNDRRYKEEHLKPRSKQCQNPLLDLAPDTQHEQGPFGQEKKLEAFNSAWLPDLGNADI
jgi:hypothetical protein